MLGSSFSLQWVKIYVELAYYWYYFSIIIFFLKKLKLDISCESSAKQSVISSHIFSKKVFENIYYKILPAAVVIGILDIKIHVLNWYTIDALNSWALLFWCSHLW